MNLAELEHFFYEAVRANAPPTGVNGVFVGTARLSAIRRMGIYHSAYWARQVRTLAETFPNVSRAIGEAHFHRVARAYLVECPSAKPAIELAGERFPAFVEQRQAELPSLVPALARLEWARTEALLAPDPPALVRRDELAGIELWRFRAVLAAHVRVLRLPKSALAFVAREEETSVDPSSDEGVCTVVFRRSHKVKHVALDDPEGHAIELAEKGRPFAEVCESFGNVSVGEIAGRIGSWIDRGWIERLEEGST